MKRDLVKIGQDLVEKVPFHPIVREFEVKNEKYHILVGWSWSNALVERYDCIGKDWVTENWSAIPRTVLSALTKSIKEEADALLKSMDEFIEKECEAEIRETITDVICKKAVTKSRQEILVDAINSRIKKMSDHFQTFPRPSTFTEFTIERSFDVPKPQSVDKQRWEDMGKQISINISPEGFCLADNSACDNTQDAMMILMVIPQIAEFALMVYTQLSRLAEWEKSQ